MSLNVRLRKIKGDANAKATIDRIARASTATIKQAANEIKTGGRASIASGGFGKKWQNSFRVDVFPKSGNSLSPAAFARHKIPYAGVFEEGATISGKPLLWLPLPSVPMGRGGKRMTPKEFSSQIANLYTVKKAGRRPMLAAIVRTTDKRMAKGLSWAALRRARNPGGRGTVRYVPMYVGVSTVTDPRKFNIAGVVKRVEAELPALYAKNWESLNNGG